MKTVALIDPYSSGHHYAFIRLFAKYFLKDGNRICIIYPEKEKEIREYLIEEGFDNRLIYFEESLPQKKVIPGDGIWKLPLSTLHLWRNTNQLLKHVEKKQQLKFDFVFFAWLDDYLCNYLHHNLVDFVFNYKWSGLFFHPWYLNHNLTTRVTFSSLDSVLLSKKCMSVAVHDEFNIETLFNRIKKKVVLFPEIADSTPPITYGLADEIKSKADGRVIVGLVGISHRKGFSTFVRAVSECDPNKFFFFFSGIPEADFSPSDAQRVNDFLGSVPTNCLYYPGYIEEGAKLNAVINNFDIIFLVYNNFQSSSNFITKAALFKKLVISTDRFWMGRATKKYQLGLTVKEATPNMAVKGLLDLVSDRNELLAQADWQGYLSVHGEENLQHAIREIMSF